MNSKKNVRRYDLGEIRQVERTPQGFLKIPAFVTRCGIFPYVSADGSVRRELRHPEDVFDVESLASLKNAVVTLEHPPEMVTPENFEEYSVGYTTDRVEPNGQLVDADLIVAKAEAIEAVDQGKRETSAGYLADVIEEEGVYNGVAYNYRQKNIRYNHVAIVDRGRAGPEVRLRLDSADAVMQDGFEESKHPRSQNGEFGSGSNSRSSVKPETSHTTLKTGHTVKVMSGDQNVGGTGKIVGETRSGKLMVHFGGKSEPKAIHPSDLKKVSESSNEDSEMKNDESSETKKVKISGQEVELPAHQADVVQALLDRYDEMRAKLMDLEGQMKKDSQKKDVDVSQQGVSAKPAVEQMAPDGRNAGAKKDADVLGQGEGAGKGQAEAHEKDDEGDEHGTSMSPTEKMMKDFEDLKNAHAELQAKHDELKEKHDEMASKTLGQPAGEGKPSGFPPHKDEDEKKMDSARDLIRKRVRLERQAGAHLSEEQVEKFDSMSDVDVMSAVIKKYRPQADLNGKGSVYIQSRFDSIIEELGEGEKVRKEMGSQFLRRMDSEQSDPRAARKQAMAEAKAMWQQPLSAQKK